MKRMLVMVACAAAVLTAMMPGHAATAGALAGTGTTEFGECLPDSLQVSIQGTEVATGDWTFTAHAVNTDVGCEFPAIAVAFRGPWTPAGGCVPMIVTDALLGESHLCLTNPTPNGPLTDYEFTVCDRNPCGRQEIPDIVTVLVTEA